MNNANVTPRLEDLVRRLTTLDQTLQGVLRDARRAGAAADAPAAASDHLDLANEEIFWKDFTTGEEIVTALRYLISACNHLSLDFDEMLKDARSK